MTSTQIRKPQSFGQRNEAPVIIISNNGRTRKLRIHPAVMAAGMCFAFICLAGYLGATAYLIFRDDLLSASISRQARIQHEYEDRIAALRAKLDRVTSRQLLDQQAIEVRVEELLARQANIGGRSNKFDELLQKARKRGIEGAILSPPIPQGRPGQELQEQTGLDITAGSKSASLSFLPSNEVDPINTGSLKPQFNSRFTEEIFGDVAEAISVIDQSQRREIDYLRLTATDRTMQIAKALKKVGASLPETMSANIGGPFVELDNGAEFNQHLAALETSLKRYDSITQIAQGLPFNEPIPGAKISSRYGQRVDPFNGRVAMHAGTDFRAKTGTPVRATGAGKVVKAGRNGGYGKVVELRHRDGFITRYAHLSRILVKVGQRVEPGTLVGKVGSTGRSTGPHLHYEVRKGKKAHDPARFMKAGYKLRGIM